MAVDRPGSVCLRPMAPEGETMIDDDPMTEARRTAVQFVNDGKAALAQVWATLDLADAVREQTAQLEAIDIAQSYRQTR